ncbi:replication initiation protein [Acinetobacter sichuanensis]|uniref:Replication initiation protein n=1 Tax=Acinetobacter sichuanensis TaxID=2136183 RepID=A0ABV7BD23_9GAMM|nr:replication initiation protein [Acinetobacter sichuanensis]
MSKKILVNDFTEKDKEFFPLSSPQKKYPEQLAVLQNAFWQLRHEKPPKDDLLKLLMFFSPKIRLSDGLPTEQTSFSITAKEYSDLTGLNIKGAYAALDRVVDALYNHSVIFYNEERGNVRTRLVTSTAYKNGSFTVSFTHYALHIMYVFNKQHPFTKLQIKSISGLHGHGLKLYPLLVQNEYRFNFEIAINDLKEVLNIDLESYIDYKEFKKFVLKPHIDLINLKTELSVQFKAVKKEGRKASHVSFTVTKKCTVKAENQAEKVQEKPNLKIKSIDVYRAIVDNNLLSRFLEFGENSEELINRIKDDLKNNDAQRWITKLSDFDIVL